MNLTLDLKSITDTESERSLNDFDSYDSTPEVDGEDEKFNERNIVDGDDDDDDDDDDDEKEEEGNEENDEECEFAMRLRENLKSYESSLSGGDSLLNFKEFEFDYGRYYGLYERRFDAYDQRCRGVSNRTRRNGDLVCFYVNTVTESNDLTKYLRPEYRKLKKCDCWPRNFWPNPVGNSLESLSIGKQEEGKNDSDFWKFRSRFDGGCSFRSSFATYKRLDEYEKTFRRFLFQKLLVPSAPSLVSSACRLQEDRSEALPLDFCPCSTTSGRRERLVTSNCDELDGYATSLANAAQSARNLARDLDKLLSNLNTQNGA